MLKHVNNLIAKTKSAARQPNECYHLRTVVSGVTMVRSHEAGYISGIFQSFKWKQYHHMVTRLRQSMERVRTRQQWLGVLNIHVDLREKEWFGVLYVLYMWYRYVLYVHECSEHRPVHILWRATHEMSYSLVLHSLRQSLLLDPKAHPLSWAGCQVSFGTPICSAGAAVMYSRA